MWVVEVRTSWRDGRRSGVNDEVVGAYAADERDEGAVEGFRVDDICSEKDCYYREQRKMKLEEGWIEWRRKRVISTRRRLDQEVDEEELRYR